VENNYYNVIRVYEVCKSRVPVEILSLFGKSISDIVIKKRGICVEGRVCVGDTLAAARRAFPSAKTIVEYQEDQVLYMRLGEFVTLGFNVKDLEFDCPPIPDDKCLSRALSRKATDITISDRMKP
jgi:hypothetical protein